MASSKSASSSQVQSEQGALRSSQISSSASKKSEYSPKIDPKQAKKVQFKDFDIIEVLGEGSFGRVFKGRKKDDGQVFALKVMKK